MPASPPRGCRQLGGLNVAKAVTGSGIAFLGALAFDRLVYSEYTGVAKVVYLSLNGLCFLVADHPLTLGTMAIPTALVLRQALLASGGINMMFGIGLAANCASDELHHFSGLKSAGNSGVDRKERLLQIAASVHQLACWYLVPRADWIWSLVIGFLDGHKSRWLCTIGVSIGLGLWSVSGFLLPSIKVYYPRMYTRQLNYLKERPLFYADTALRVIHKYLHQFIFHTAFGRSPQYRYRPLLETQSELRLLKIRAGSSWETVKANIINTPISETPPFEAISYRWAFGNDVPILLDEQRFGVSDEVHEILRTLRYRRKDRIIWLDSICIDQTNIDEKAWQIGLMRQIYSSSEQVIAWIAVMRQLPFLPGPFSSLAELAALNESADNFSQSFLHGDLCGELRASIISLTNEFFFRTWIIQEIALANKLTIKFRSDETSWDDFYGAVKAFVLFHAVHASIANFGSIIHSRMSRTADNIHIMEQFRFARKNSPDGLPLSELLLGSIDFEATDPRDRVYGLLGLSTSNARKAISVLYSPDVTHIPVLVNAVRFTLLVERSFSLLELGGIGYFDCEQAHSLDGPSWLFRSHYDHDASYPAAWLKTLAQTCNKHYRTAKWIPANIYDDGDHFSSVLRMQSFYIDRIRILSPAWSPLDRIVKADFSTFEQWYSLYSVLSDLVEATFHMVQYANHPVYEGLDRRSLAWRTICHDSRKSLMTDAQSFEQDGKQVENHLRNILQQLRALKERGFNGWDALEGLRLSSNLAVLANIFPMQGTRLCLTDSGFFGIVPPFTQQGDQIWAFSGAPNPFVLRTCSASLEPSQGAKTYELVGVCYIDGIMHGELEAVRLKPTMVNLV